VSRVLADDGLVSWVLAQAAVWGLNLWRQQTGAIPKQGRWIHLCPEGTGDVAGYSRVGRFIGIECKRLGARTEAERAKKQAAWRERVNATQFGAAYQVESREEVIEVFKHIVEEDERWLTRIGLTSQDSSPS